MLEIRLPLLAAVLVAGAAGPARAQPAPWEADRRLTRSRAASQTSINFARSVAADGCGHVHVVWTDGRDGNPEVYWKRSADGGRTWSPPLRLTANAGTSRNPSVAVQGSAVHVVWFDDSSGRPQVHYRRSTDAGLTWQPAKRITATPSTAAWPSVAVQDRKVHVVYVDTRDGNAEVYYLRSLDGGASWTREVRLSDRPHNSYTPAIAVAGPNVYVAWTDTRHGRPTSLEEEYFKRSSDDGRTWSSDVRLTQDPANSWAPSLAASGPDVWIAWFDERDGNWEVYLKRSADRGRTWSADRRLTRDGASSARPSIAAQGSRLRIVFQDTRDGNSEVYLKESPDRGKTWGPDTRLTSNPGSSTLASVAATDAGAFVVWQETRDGNPEVYFKRAPGIPIEVGNGVVAFARRVQGLPQLFTARPDRTGERQLTSKGANMMPAWSKDGSQLAFVSTRSGVPELWVMNADGSEQRQLTRAAPAQSFVPDWSADGTRLAFARLDPRVGHPEVWTMNADGSDARRLTFTPGNPKGPTWSLLPSFSPGDDRIVYASTRSGSTQIWMMFSNGLGQKQKTRGLGRDFPDANVPEWSRDGKRIVFWSGFERRFGEVWTMDPTGGSTKQVTRTRDPLSSDNPAWAPDGSRILFDSNRSGTAVHVYSVAPDGSNLVLQASGGFGQTAWQPVFGRRYPTFGRGCAGSNRLVPVLGAAGCASPGGRFTLAVRQGVGRMPAAFLLGPAPAAVVLPGGCSLLVVPLVPIAVVLDPGGAAAVEIPVPLHAGPLVVYAQAFLGDTGRSTGFSASNGVIVPVQ